MNSDFHPSILLFRFTENDPCCQDIAVLVTLGQGATALTERIRDYVLAIPEFNWMENLGNITPFVLNPVSIGEVSRYIPTVLAISGSLSPEEIQFASRLMERGGHCTVLVDDSTEIRPEWRSVIQLPPLKSRDEQWLVGMQGYLDAIFNHGLVCLDSENLLAVTKNHLSQLAMVQAEEMSWSTSTVDAAIQELASRCDLAQCDTYLLLFHTGPAVKMKEIHWGVQACKNALAGFRDNEYLLNVGHLPRLKSGHAISLIAGKPRPYDLSACIKPDHIII